MDQQETVNGISMYLWCFWKWDITAKTIACVVEQILSWYKMIQFHWLQWRYTQFMPEKYVVLYPFIYKLVAMT